MVQDSNPGRNKRCFLLQEHPDWLWGPPGYQGSFLGHEVNSSPISAKVNAFMTRRGKEIYLLLYV
jgi:hypothetical protein